MIDAEKIDWKEAFWWFFWDVCANDEDESYEPGTYNDFVSEIISRERLPINTINHPKSWDHLLWHIMRATVYDRGLGSELSEAARFVWLEHPPSPKRRPFVNWMDFQDTRAWDLRSFEMEPEPNSSWVLGYLESRVYGRLSTENGLRTTMAEAWSRNPHLVNFQTTCNLPLPWAVPLQKIPEEKTYQILSTWPLKVVFDNSLGIAHLISTGNGKLDRNAVNEARYYFTGMLRWARDVSVSGRMCSIRPYMQGGQDALNLAAGQQVALSKALWKALKELKDLGHDKIAPKPIAATDSVNRLLPSPASAKRSASTLGTFRTKVKKQKKVSYFCDSEGDSD